MSYLGPACIKCYPVIPFPRYCKKDMSLIEVYPEACSLFLFSF